jgi:hypothetical protein
MTSPKTRPSSIFISLLLEFGQGMPCHYFFFSGILGVSERELYHKNWEKSNRPTSLYSAEAS